LAAVVGLSAGDSTCVGNTSQAEATETELANASAVTSERILNILSSKILFNNY
jgi:hypothetical protein